MRPIALALRSANHSAPSAPATIGPGRLSAGSVNSVIAPAVVMRPTLLALGLGEPQRAVRAGRDVGGERVGRRDRVLGHGAVAVEAADRVAARLGEPQRAVGAEHDVARERARVDG